jgi:UDP-N-acetylglucosamine:LPS N-acetylglucosamine transferase
MHAFPIPARQRITIVSASVGAGHDGAAAELEHRLTDRGFAVDRHDFLDLLPAAIGRMLRRAYATQLKVAPDSWGHLFTALERHRPLAAFAVGVGRSAARRTRRALPADTGLVISTYPLASQALGAARLRGLLDVPVVTYLTDMSVHPLWVAEGVDAHLALHEVPAAAARRLGGAGVTVGGPAVPVTFRPAVSSTERAAARLRFGLPAGRPLALVVAGSWGAGDVEGTARDIATTGLATPVVVCGRNTALRDKLARAGIGIALGWMDDMAALLHACDVVVQNAGGLSSLEALAAGLPVLSYRCLPGHGSTNAAALEQAGWATWAQRPETLAAMLAGALSPQPPRLPAPAPDPAAIIESMVRPVAAALAAPVPVAAASKSPSFTTPTPRPAEMAPNGPGEPALGEAAAGVVREIDGVGVRLKADDDELSLAVGAL